MSKEFSPRKIMLPILLATGLGVAGCGQDQNLTQPALYPSPIPTENPTAIPTPEERIETKDVPSFMRKDAQLTFGYFLVPSLIPPELQEALYYFKDDDPTSQPYVGAIFANEKAFYFFSLVYSRQNSSEITAIILGVFLKEEIPKEDFDQDKVLETWARHSTLQPQAPFNCSQSYTSRECQAYWENKDYITSIGIQSPSGNKDFNGTKVNFLWRKNRSSR